MQLSEKELQKLVSIKCDGTSVSAEELEKSLVYGFKTLKALLLTLSLIFQL